MTSSGALACERCGSPLETAERLGDYVRYQCPSCGYELEGTISFAHMMPREKWVSLRARWQGSGPSTKELRVLRELFPPFAQRSLSQLVQDLRQVTSLDLGRFVESQARDLEEEAHKRGLTVEVDDSLPTDHR